MTAGEMPTLPKEAFQEWFAPKAQRPSCLQRPPSSSRGPTNHKASSELLVPQRKLRTGAETAARCRADARLGTNTRKDISSDAGLQPHRSCPCFQGQQLFCYNPTSSIIFLCKAKLYKENPHSLCFRNTRLCGGVTLRGTKACLTA